MKAHYQKLLDYNFWANRLYLACLLDNTIVNNKVYLLFSHVLTAEQVWLCRSQQQEAPLQSLWEVYPNDTLAKMVEENSKAWRSYFDQLEEQQLAQELSYVNTKGEKYLTRLDDIITHLVNHGTHHRAQIASMLQHEKVLAPGSDYIFYLRDQHLATI